jgi:selenoprotein W-related protein
VTLIPSSGGVYEITFGDALIYSKKETGKFPEPQEIVATVAAG